MKILFVKGMLVLLDDEDYEWAKKYKIHVTKRCQVRRLIWDMKTKRVITIHLSREIMKAPEGMEVDHINHNRLDNRKCNLRIVTVSQNQMNRGLPRNNTTGYKGLIKIKNGWEARVSYTDYNHKKKYTRAGRSNNIKEAAALYNKKARELHGEYAWLNPL